MNSEYQSWESFFILVTNLNYIAIDYTNLEITINRKRGITGIYSDFKV